MNPVGWLNAWLDGRTEPELWMIILCCGFGIYVVLLCLLIGGFESGFRVRRKRRRGW